MILKEVTVRQHFKEFIEEEVVEIEGGEQMKLELLAPYSFLEGLNQLGLGDLDETEVQCLMLILIKPELENQILVNDLVMVMENFQIIEPESENGPSAFVKGEDQEMKF